MDIDGVEVESKKNVTVVRITKLTDDLKSLIEDELSSICHGARKVGKKPKVYSTKKTVREFLKRYNSKGKTTKKGMVGELLAQVVIKVQKPKLVSASPLFNMEERSIKKGFDIVLYEKKERSVWITEVKAGAAGKKTSNSKNKILVESAKKDAHEKFNDERESLWLNAVNGAYVAISKKNIRQRVIDTLEQALDEIQNEEDLTFKKNVILVSVVYKAVSDKISFEDVREICERIVKENIFDKIVLLSLQKGTFSKVEQFLKQELS